jgi:anti-anti-sigma regulatory factor
MIEKDQSIKLEGSLSGPWVEELRKTCLADADSTDSTRCADITIDLSGVTFVDEEGRALLIKIRRTGAVLHGASPFVRQVLNETEGEK